MDLARTKGIMGADKAILDFAKIIIKNRFGMTEVRYIEENS